MRGGENGVARAGGLGGGQPFIRIEFVRLVKIGIPRLARGIVCRGVTGGDGEIEVIDDADLGILPGDLGRRGQNQPVDVGLSRPQ